MNPLLTPTNILPTLRLISQVSSRLELLSLTLHEIPGLDPTAMKAKYGTPDPFNIHTRFNDVYTSFKALEDKLVRDPDVPPAPSFVEMPGLGEFPGQRMHQVEVEFPEYDFRAWLSAQAVGMEESDGGAGAGQ